MKYQLPDWEFVQTQLRSQVERVVIDRERRESLLDIANRIVRKAIQMSPPLSELGMLDPRAFEPLLTSSDIRWIAQQVRSGEVSIDYWKGRPVKLSMTISSSIAINLSSWSDRYEGPLYRISKEAYENLKEVLEAVASEVPKQKE